MAHGFELCGRCGHMLDRHEKNHCTERVAGVAEDGGERLPVIGSCPCPAPIRTDAMLCMQMSELLQRARRANALLETLLVVTCEVAGVEVTEDGKVRRKLQIAVP